MLLKLMLKRLISRKYNTELQKKAVLPNFQNIKTFFGASSLEISASWATIPSLPRCHAEFGKEGEEGRQGVTAAICHRQRRGALTLDREHC